MRLTVDSWIKRCQLGSLVTTSQYPVARSPSCSRLPSARLATPSQCLCMHSRHMGPPVMRVVQSLLSDECPPTCSTGSLAGSVPNMAITSVANTFSVTFCRLIRSISVRSCSFSAAAEISTDQQASGRSVGGVCVAATHAHTHTRISIVY